LGAIRLIAALLQDLMVVLANVHKPNLENNAAPNACRYRGGAAPRKGVFAGGA